MTIAELIKDLRESYALSDTVTLVDVTVKTGNRSSKIKYRATWETKPTPKA